ncbi:serine-threonine protein kinase, putative [Entamoeba histolytica HM-3:IMSS]|uniref:Serine-threonine protein kinase, putative n=1 Tax=Entamoeba histolytica HM-3:IMSS TaxID=885315 RepID=M7WTZ7_ENTHI|nr:serine-threonine protein kinase, putative [Entamoeba histolytica HM-3:IMSS]
MSAQVNKHIKGITKVDNRTSHKSKSTCTFNEQTRNATSCCLFVKTKENETEGEQCTIEGIPLFVEHSFRFFELSSKIEKEVPPVPLQYLTYDTALLWASENMSKNFVDLVKMYKMDGNAISRLKMQDLRKYKFRIVECDTVLKKIKAYFHITNFGKRLLKNQGIDDSDLRQMYKYIDNHHNGKLIPFNSMDKKQASTVAFLIIRNYLCSFDEIISETSFGEMIKFYHDHMRDDDDSFVRSFDKVLQTCLTPLQYNVLIRTLRFMLVIMNSRGSVFVHFQDVFKKTMFSLISPISLDMDFTFLLIFYSLKSRKPTNYIKMNLFQLNNKLLYGEYIIKQFDDILISDKTYTFHKQMNDVSTKEWERGRIYITNFRVWWVPNDEECFQRNTRLLLLSYIPIRSIMEMKSFDSKEDITKEKKVCVRMYDNLLRLFLFAFQSIQQLQDFRDELQMASVFEDNYPIDDVECISYEIPFKNYGEKKINRNGIHINSNEFKVFKEEENEYVIPYQLNNVDENKELPNIRGCIFLYKHSNGCTICRLSLSKTVDKTKSFFLSTIDEVQKKYHAIYLSPQEKNDSMILKTSDEVNIIWNKIVDSAKKFTETTNFKEITTIFDEYIKYISIVFNNVFSLFVKVKLGESIMLQTRRDNETELPLYSSLIQFITDKYYWTYNGFVELIFVEFIQSNYFFFCNNGEICPIPHSFLIFIRIISLFVMTIPSAFEFSQQLLNYLELICMSGRLRFNESRSQRSIVRLLVMKNKLKNQRYNSSTNVSLIDMYNENLFSVQSLVLLFLKWMNVGKNCNFPLNPSIQNLDLQNKGIIALPVQENLKECHQLTQLNISQNHLITIPSQITELSQLKDLNISTCSIYYIPYNCFSQLTNLTSLDISETSAINSELIKFPSFSFLTKLEYLDISNHCKASGESIYLELPCSLRTFIAKQSLQTLPDLSKLKCLEKLDISDNRQLKLNALAEVSSLRTFICRNRTTSTFPQQLFSIKLRYLDLSCDKIERLPQAFYNCITLESLNLSNNQISTLSSQLSMLKNLKTLLIDNNPLTSKITLKPIPNSIPMSYPCCVHVFCTKGFYSIFKKMIKMNKKSNFEFVSEISANSTKPQLILNFVDVEKTVIPYGMANDDLYIIHQEVKDQAGLITHHILSNEKKYYFIGEKKMCCLLKKRKCKRSGTIGSDVEIIDAGPSMVDKLVSSINSELNYKKEIRRIGMELYQTQYEEVTLTTKQMIQLVKFYNSNCDQTTLDELSNIGVIFDLKKTEEGISECVKKGSESCPKGRYILRQVFDKKKNLVEKELSSFRPLREYFERLNKMTSDDIINICRILQTHNALFMIYPNWINEMGITAESEKVIEKLKIPVEQPKRNKLNWKVGASGTNKRCSLAETGSLSKRRSESLSPDEGGERLASKKDIFPVVLHPSIIKMKENAWPLHSKNEMEIMREFVLGKPCYLMYMQLIGYLLLIGMELYDKIYNDATILKDERYSTTFLIKIQYCDGRISISIRYNTSSVSQVKISADIMQSIKKAINTIAVASNNTLEEYVGCTECILKDEKKIDVVPVKEIKEARKEGKTEILFNKQHSVMIGTCALDILLNEMENSSIVPLFESKDMDIKEMKGFGGSAKVNRVIVSHKEEMAFKMYTFNNYDKVSLKIGLGSTAHLVALKVEEMMKELEVLKLTRGSSIRHTKYILQLHGICLEPLGILVDYMGEGTLQNYIGIKSNELPMTMVLRFAKNINNALDVLHSRNIIHRDVKSPNVLLKFNQQHQLIAVLSDFGLSGPYDENEHCMVENPLWLPPEVLNTHHFLTASDIYAYGIILWEMITREKPFVGCKFMSEIANKIRAGERPQFKPNILIDNSLKELIEMCWLEDPSKRPCCSQIKKVLQKVSKNLPH